MRIPSVVVVLPVALFALTACGESSTPAAPAVAKPKKISSQADCVKYLSADEVRQAAGVRAATVHKAAVPGDCTFDLAERESGSGGMVQLLFGEDKVLPASAATEPFEGNPARQKLDSPGADAQHCMYTVLLQPGGGVNSSMLVNVLFVEKGRDACSVAHNVARIVFDKLPSS